MRRAVVAVDPARATVLDDRTPFRFFALVTALAIPLWAIGALTGGALTSSGGTDLPFAALTFVCPLLAAALLVHRRQGTAGVRSLMARMLDPRPVRRRIWYLPIVGLLPAIYALSYILQRLAGVGLPAPHLSPGTVAMLFVFFTFSAVCEETGWTGYAIDPLQARWGALTASLVVGAVWGGFHVVPDLQAGRTWSWITGQRAFSLALRVLIVWVYANTGRRAQGPILLHAMDNVSVYTLFPDNGGGHYDPAVTAAITAVAATGVALLWGRRTLARFRPARRPPGSPAEETRPSANASVLHGEERHRCPHAS